MSLSQKCQYAVRAVYELAKRRESGVPTPTVQIAKAQAIPARFLEAILSQLRQGGFVESRRGVSGGYVLMASPAELTVGQVIQFVEGGFDPVQCSSDGGSVRCSLQGKCVFIRLWQKARDAVSDVYKTTFKDLLEQEQTCEDGVVTNYMI